MFIWYPLLLPVFKSSPGEKKCIFSLCFLFRSHLFFHKERCACDKMMMTTERQHFFHIFWVFLKCNWNFFLSSSSFVRVLHLIHDMKLNWLQHRQRKKNCEINLNCNQKCVLSSSQISQMDEKISKKKSSVDFLTFSEKILETQKNSFFDFLNHRLPWDNNTQRFFPSFSGFSHNIRNTRNKTEKMNEEESSLC